MSAGSMPNLTATGTALRTLRRTTDAAVRYTSSTAVLAGFLFSFRTILVLVSARWLDAGTEPGVAAGLLMGLTLLLLAWFQGVGQAARPIGWASRVPSVRWVLFFLAFSCTSLLWSATVSPLGSFLYWCGIAVDVATIALLLRSASADEVTHSLFKGFIWSSNALALIAWIMPAQSDLRLGDMDFFNTNQIGNLCALGIFMAQFLVSRKDGKWTGSLLLLSLTLLRSLSKTTLIAFIAGQLFLLVNDRTIGRKKKAFIVLSCLLVIVLFSTLISTYYSTYTAAGNQAETLTGRTAIWAYTLDAALKRPWFGNGIDSMWKVFPPFGNELFEARHAENELLQQFFAYGAAGIVMLVGLYGSLLRSIRKLAAGRARSILIGVVLFVVVRGLAEAEPFDLLLPLWAITLVSCLVVGTAQSRQATCRLISNCLEESVR